MAARIPRSSFSALTLPLAIASLTAQTPGPSTELTYQTTPEVMVKILDAAPTPNA